MANLKAGTLIGGNLIWNSGNLDLKVVEADKRLDFMGYQVYHEGHNPTPAEVGAVSKTGDIMTGNLIIRHGNNAELRIDAGTNKYSQLYMSEDNQKMGHYIKYRGDGDNATYFGTIQDGVEKNYIKIPRFGGARFTIAPVSEAVQGTENGSLTRKDYVDSKDALKVNKAGDSMTGRLLVIGAKDNSTPSADTVKLDGYGLIGNRGVVYLTNASPTGTVTIGVGGAHNVGKQLVINSSASTFSTSVLTSSAQSSAGNSLTRKDYVDGKTDSLESDKLDKTLPSVGVKNESTSTTGTDWDTFIPEYFKLHTTSVNSPTDNASHGFFLPHQGSFGSKFGTQFSARDRQFYLRSRSNEVWQPWDKLYTTFNKPTWSDVGGDTRIQHRVGDERTEYVFMHTAGKDSLWIRPEHNPESIGNSGFLPPAFATGGDAQGYVGKSDWWFKESWVNTYRGGSVDVDGTINATELNISHSGKFSSNSGEVYVLNGKVSSDGYRSISIKSDGSINAYSSTHGYKKIYHEGFKPTLDSLSGTAANAQKLDNLDSTQFLRSDVDDSMAGWIEMTNRSKGLTGVYDSNKTQTIWAIGKAYPGDATGANFGKLYGLAYKHTNNTTGGTMAGGHQMVWCSNGTPKSAVGDGLWTSGNITGNIANISGGYNFNGKTAIGGANDTWLRLNPDGEFSSGTHVHGNLQSSTRVSAPLMVVSNPTAFALQIGSGGFVGTNHANRMTFYASTDLDETKNGWLFRTRNEGVGLEDCFYINPNGDITSRGRGYFTGLTVKRSSGSTTGDDVFGITIQDSSAEYILDNRNDSGGSDHKFMYYPTSASSPTNIATLNSNGLTVYRYSNTGPSGWNRCIHLASPGHQGISGNKAGIGFHDSSPSADGGIYFWNRASNGTGGTYIGNWGTGGLSVSGDGAGITLNLTANGKFTKIGSRNSTWSHFETDATNGFYSYDHWEFPSLKSRGYITATNEVNANNLYLQGSGRQHIRWTNTSGAATAYIWKDPSTDYLTHTATSRFEKGIGRTSHSSGYLEGSYNNVGDNAQKTNPIYIIGSNYKPSDTALGNMYGIGYCYGNAPWVTSGTGQSAGWGAYFASDGDARVFIDAANGNINARNTLHLNGYAYNKKSVRITANPGSTSWGADKNAFIDFGGASPTGSTATYMLRYKDTNNKRIFAIDTLDQSGHTYIRINTGATYSFDTGGNFTASGNVTAYSDKRIKKDIEVIDNALEKVSKMRGVYYKRTDTEDDKRRVGVIAQEMEEVLPEVVNTSVDHESEFKDLKSVAYGDITAVLIEAIKELKAEIEELKASK